MTIDPSLHERMDELMRRIQHCEEVLEKLDIIVQRVNVVIPPPSSTTIRIFEEKPPSRYDPRFPFDI